VRTTGTCNIAGSDSGVAEDASLRIVTLGHLTCGSELFNLADEGTSVLQNIRKN
jgi:hypothetical protein